MKRKSEELCGCVPDSLTFYSLQIKIYHYSLDLLLQRGSSVINCSRVAVNEEGNLGSAQPGAGSLQTFSTTKKQSQPSSFLNYQHPSKYKETPRKAKL